MNLGCYLYILIIYEFIFFDLFLEIKYFYNSDLYLLRLCNKLNYNYIVGIVFRCNNLRILIV